MMKCTTCNKEITKPYFLDGKAYGYNCYKVALSMKLALLQELKNEEWSRKCVALLTVFEQKTFKDSWNKDFQQSVLTQWNEHKKLSAKQFDCIIKKFSDNETLEYYLTYYEMFGYEDVNPNTNYVYSHLINKSETLQEYKEDERVYTFLKTYYQYPISKGKKYYIVGSYEIGFNDEKVFYEIIRENNLNGYKEDEDLKVVEIIEVQ